MSKHKPDRTAAVLRYVQDELAEAARRGTIIDYDYKVEQDPEDGEIIVSVSASLVLGSSRNNVGSY